MSNCPLFVTGQLFIWNILVPRAHKSSNQLELKPQSGTRISCVNSVLISIRNAKEYFWERTSRVVLLFKDILVQSFLYVESNSLPLLEEMVFLKKLDLEVSVGKVYQKRLKIWEELPVVFNLTLHSWFEDSFSNFLTQLLTFLAWLLLK